MRIATYSHGADRSCVGVVETDAAGDLVVRSLPTTLTATELIRAGIGVIDELASRAGAPIALSEVRLEPPLAPASIRDFVAFEEHVEGVRRSIDGSAGVPDAWYDAPTFYFTNPHALIGDGADVAFPARSLARDFELEVAAVVGTEGTSLDLAEAEAAIFGYLVMNDWSARDLQGREMQVSLGPAKGKDFATTLGPWIVTADELAEYRDEDGFLRLGCTVRVNGVEIGRDLLSNMGWSFPALVAYASRDSRVVPGDVLGSGTTGNGGCLAELWGTRGEEAPPPLVDGDVVTITVDGLGTITNRITSAPATPTLPGFRKPSRERPAGVRIEA